MPDCAIYQLASFSRSSKNAPYYRPPPATTVYSVRLHHFNSKGKGADLIDLPDQLAHMSEQPPVDDGAFRSMGLDGVKNPAGCGRGITMFFHKAYRKAARDFAIKHDLIEAGDEV